MPVTPSIGLVTSAPDRRVLHDNRWLSGHRRLRGAQGHDFFARPQLERKRRPIIFSRWPHSLVCGECGQRFSLYAMPADQAAEQQNLIGARCANGAVLRRKVTGRAGRRRGYQMRSYDGRAQPRAVWAMPRPVERAQASDDADDRERARSAFRSRPCL